MLDADEQADVQVQLDKVKQKIAAAEALLATGTDVQLVTVASQLLAAASAAALKLTAEAVD